jgi:hypothetical protein
MHGLCIDTIRMMMHKKLWVMMNQQHELYEKQLKIAKSISSIDDEEQIIMDVCLLKMSE